MIYQGQNFEEERALYGIKDAQVLECTFSGPADGESALKECKNLLITDCNFQLRYPLWHVDIASIQHSAMTETCRAALWYDRNITIEHSRLGGIKALRECDHSILSHCDIESTEFGWFCREIKMEECTLISEYPFLQTRDMDVTGLTMKGKYSFQYVENAVIRNSVLDTKDAFWHSKNVTVYDSVVKGEYLAWYSHGSSGAYFCSYCRHSASGCARIA